MNNRVIANLIGKILCVEAAFLLPAAAVSAYYREPAAFKAILLTIAYMVLAGTILLLLRPDRKIYYAREGFVSVALAWIVMSVFGALPFYLSGEIPSFLDSFFETVSGFTTTGASILRDIEGLSKGLLYWRSFTHWLGGMGVLVFVLAFRSLDRNGGRGQSVHLLRAESPGPDVEKLVPRMHHSAKILYGIYIGLTVLEFVLLLAGGMPLFDSITTAYGTAGTGGFAIRADSIGGYSPYLQNVVTVFMALFGVNFSVYFLLLLRKPREAFGSAELRLYVAILVVATALIAWNISGMYGTLEETIRHSAFQVSSIMTTTGYCTTDFNLWPEFSKTILLILMLIGACAGSTGGGIKVSRLLLLYKSLRCELKRMLSPRTVRVVSVDGRTVDAQTLRGVSLYMTAYLFICGASLLLLSLNQFGLEVSFSAVMACLNNIGPGFGIAGPLGGYADFSVLSKLVLCMDMLIGRLEIFPILLLCAPQTWIHRKI